MHRLAPHRLRPPRIGWAVVRGRSMRPTLREGDRVLVVYGGRVRAGRLVLARFPDGTLAVKRAVERRSTATGAPGWWLLSDRPQEGVDSRHRGPVADASVVAVVLARVWPPRVTGLVGRLPGVAAVRAQVPAYAAAWDDRNRVALAGDGPVWAVLGDSMSQGIGASTLAGGWVPRTAAALARAGRPFRVVNLSRAGAGARDVEERQLPALGALGVEPDLVTLLVGANDMLRAGERRELEARFTRIVDRLPPSAVVAHLPQPVPTARAVNRRIDAAAARAGFATLDLRPVARRLRGHRAPDLFHPNDRAYRRIAEAFTAAALTLDHPTRADDGAPDSS